MICILYVLYKHIYISIHPYSPIPYPLTPHPIPPLYPFPPIYNTSTLQQQMEMDIKQLELQLNRVKEEVTVGVGIVLEQKGPEMAEPLKKRWVVCIRLLYILS